MPWLDLPVMVTHTSAITAFLLMFVIAAVATFEVYRDSRASEAMHSTVARLALACSLAALVALVVATKLALIHAYGNSVPFADQWNGEGTTVYQPFLNGTLRWSDLAATHNEHRIAVLRLWQLGLFLFNKQWDGLVQMTANAFLHAWVAVVLCLLLWRQLGHRFLDLLWVLVLVLWALPVGWENTLSGFQAAFYFLLLFFVLPLALLPESKPVQARWWISIALLVLGLFTIASGLLNALALMLAIALRWRTDHSARPDLAASFAACAAVALLGIVIGPSSGGPFVARTVTQFAYAMLAWLAWPYFELRPYAWIPWLPIVILGIRYLSRRGRVEHLDITLLTIGVWVALQGATIAYGRGGAVADPASRYVDVLTLGVAANAVALVALFVSSRPLRLRWFLATIAFVWIGYVSLGLSWRTDRALTLEAPAAGQMRAAYPRNLRTFRATGDRQVLHRLDYPWQTPFPNADIIADLLVDPVMRPWLPPSLRHPLFEPAPAASGFVPEGTFPITPRDPTRLALGSYNASGNAATGSFESAPIECGHSGFLAVEVAGYLGLPGTSLRLVDGEGRAIVVRPRELARESWLTQYQRCPTGPFRLIARDETPNWWFAFRPPIEIGRLAVVAYPLIEEWKALMIAGAALGWLSLRLWGREGAAESHVEDRQ